MSNRKTVVTACRLVALVVLGWTMGALSAVLETEVPGRVFDETQVVRFTLTPAEGRTWAVADVRGRQVVSGTAEAKGALSLGVLPAGYYRLTVSCNGGETATADFLVVPDPATTYRGFDSQFGVDAALSSVNRPGRTPCPWLGGDSWRTTVEIVAKLGFAHLRERLSWRIVNPEPEKWDTGIYGDNIRLLRRHGLFVSDVFHDAPPFAGWKAQVPQDPVAVYDFCRKISAAFGDGVAVWEFMNEVDAGGNPAWDYASMLRAAFLGFRRGAPQASVANAGFCRPCANDYHRVLCRNALANFSDVLNLHSYADLRLSGGRVADARKMLADIGAPSREIIYTEMGCGTSVGYADADVAGHPGEKQLSFSQELTMAEAYPKNQIEMLLAGVSRTYFFVWGFYREQQNLVDFGTLRFDGTVRPIASTMAAQANALAGARPEGWLKTPEGITAVLFAARDGSQTVAYWKHTKVDGRAPVEGLPVLTLPAADGTYSGRDGFGARRSHVAADGKLALKADAFVSYVFGLKGLSAVRPAVAVRRERRARSLPEDVDAEIVCRILPDDRDFKVVAQNAKTELDGASGRMKIEVWNLSETAKSGSLAVGGGVLDGIPPTLTVPPRQSVVLACVYRPLPGTDPELLLEVGGTFGGRRLVPVAVPVRLKARLFAALERKTLSWTDAAGWTMNDSASKRSVKAVETGLAFDYSWADPSKNRWVYPRRMLEADDLNGARFLEFDVRTVQNKPENDFFCCNVFLLRSDGRREQLSWDQPSVAWETRRVELPQLPTGVRYTEIEVGCNPKGTSLDLFLRNFGALVRRNGSER